MKGLAAKLFFTCQKAGETIEEKVQKEISFTDNLRLKVHLAICEVCKRYSQQSEWLEKMIREKFFKPAEEMPAEEIEKLKSDILEKLK
jgi:hypothetical protein